MIKFRIIIFFLVLFFFNILYCFALDIKYQTELYRIEDIFFGNKNESMNYVDKLNKIEKSIFRTTYSKESLESRINRLSNFLLGGLNPKSQNTSSPSPGYENLSIKELPMEDFAQLFLQYLNEERSFKGALPLQLDDVASMVGADQSEYLLNVGYFSSINSKMQVPDERYTLAGGAGAVIEIIKGFETDTKIVTNEFLAKQLIQALLSGIDDSSIVLNPFITHVGYGFSLSPDKSKLVCVIEFVTKAGNMEPIISSITPGNKLSISGMIDSPYKFKAISLGYFSDEDILKFEPLNKDTFDLDSLKPYFPPQNYVAYGNNFNSNLIKIFSGIGLIGAIGASPFTGGATTLLAPVFLNGISHSEPKDIPLKGGVKVSSNGVFNASIPINFENKKGLYFINIIADIPSKSIPVIVSRRTVRVE